MKLKLEVTKEDLEEFQKRRKMYKTWRRNVVAVILILQCMRYMRDTVLLPTDDENFNKL